MTVFAEKNGKKYGKDNHKIKIRFSPHHPQNHLRLDSLFGDGTKAFTNPYFRHLVENPQFQCKAPPVDYAMVRLWTAER